MVTSAHVWITYMFFLNNTEATSVSWLRYHTFGYFLYLNNKTESKGHMNDWCRLSLSAPAPVSAQELRTEWTKKKDVVHSHDVHGKWHIWKLIPPFLPPKILTPPHQTRHSFIRNTVMNALIVVIIYLLSYYPHRHREGKCPHHQFLFLLPISRICSFFHQLHMWCWLTIITLNKGSGPEAEHAAGNTGNKTGSRSSPGKTSIWFHHVFNMTTIEYLSQRHPHWDPFSCIQLLYSLWSLYTLYVYFDNQRWV